jgi:uncharacterized protein
MGLVALLVLSAFGVDGDDYTIPQLAVATSAGWLVFVGALVVVSRRHGSGRPFRDFVDHYAIAFRPVDLVGIPVGVAGQLVLVPLVYAPLRAIWPDAFSQDELEQRARDLADKANGWTVALLVLVVVVGAPIVEELVYRGLLQRSLSATIGIWPGLVFTSMWFALIHISPVEIPGLFVAGLLFGAGLAITGRLGPAMLTHAAFNAAGLIMALR